MVTTKRIYEPADKDDGFRVLVDRLWPRGISKEKAKVDEWLKEVGPSNELRKWFGHKPEHYAQFAEHYKKELASNSAFQQLKHIVEMHAKVTLLYSSRDTEHNEACVLAELL